MATIDTSIYSRVGQGADFSGLPRTLAALGSLARETREQDRAEQERKTLGDLVRANTTDGQLNRDAVLQGLAQSGMGYRVPELQKQWAGADKAVSDARAADFEFRKKRTDYAQGVFSSLLADPANLTHDRVIGAAQDMVRQGFMTPDEGAQWVRSLPGDTGRLRSHITELGLRNLDAKQRFDALTPQVQAQNLGGTTQMVDTNPITNPGVVGQSLRRTMTPGEAEAARHNRVSEGQAAQRLSMERDAPRGQVITTADGGVMLVDPRGGTAQPVTGPDGKQITGRVPGRLTPAQTQNAREKLQTVAILRQQIANLKEQRGDLGMMSQGLIAGRNPVTEAGSNYDAALAALQTTVRQLTRTPGEGAMSDYESRLAQAQLPTRADYGSSIDQKIGQLEDLANVIEQGYSGMVAGSAQPQGSGQAAPRARFNPQTGQIEREGPQAPQRRRFNPETGRIE